MSNKNKRTNCRNDLTVQCNNAAADEWIRKKKKNEVIISVDEKSTKNVKIKKIIEKKNFEKEKEIEYNDVWWRWREKLECKNFYKIFHRWYNDDLEQLHEIFF